MKPSFTLDTHLLGFVPQPSLRKIGNKIIGACETIKISAQWNKAMDSNREINPLLYRKLSDAIQSYRQ